MAGKQDAVIAAIKVLEAKGEEITFEGVSRLVLETTGNEVSRSSYQIAKNKAVTIPTPDLAASQEKPSGETPPAVAPAIKRRGRPPGVKNKTATSTAARVGIPPNTTQHRVYRPQTRTADITPGTAVEMIRAAKALLSATGGDKDAARDLLDEF